MRISNTSYAITRIVGFVVSFGAFAAITCAAIVSDEPWRVRMAAVVFVVVLMLLAFRAAYRAVLWAELDEDGVRVRRALRTIRLPWCDVASMRVDREMTWVMHGIPFRSYDLLIIEPQKGTAIKIHLESQLAQQLRAESGDIIRLFADTADTGQ